jgi:hypothetical protein
LQHRYNYCRKLTKLKQISFPIKRTNWRHKIKQAKLSSASTENETRKEAGSEDIFIRHFGSNESAGLMKPLTVMDDPFKLRARRVGVGRDTEGDGKLLHLAARVFITALQCAAGVRALLTVAMTSASACIMSYGD